MEGAAAPVLARRLPGTGKTYTISRNVTGANAFAGENLRSSPTNSYGPERARLA